MIYKSVDIPNAEYHSHEAISSSGLKYIYETKSVYHYLNREYKEPTEAMELGSATHTAILEPEKFQDEYLITPELDRRKKHGKQLYEQYKSQAIEQNKTLLRHKNYELIKKMKASVYSYPLAYELLQGIVELSHFALIDEVDVRIRPDIDIPKKQCIVDLKTCNDNSPFGFGQAIYHRNYDLQAYMYCLVKGYPCENFRFIAVENKHPYSTEVYALSEKSIENGKKKFEQALSQWKYYKITGIALMYDYDDMRFTKDGSIML